MDVVLRQRRNVEVDDVAERFDVDAARGDVGRDEHAIPAALESLERVGALRLRPIAVNARDARRRACRDTPTDDSRDASCA